MTFDCFALIAIAVEKRMVAFVHMKRHNMTKTQKKLQPKDVDAYRYMILCNLIETIWAQSTEKDYYNVDLDNLIPFTSPQARRIASFIDDLYQEGGTEGYYDKLWGD